jgi:predicted secreted protein
VSPVTAVAIYFVVWWIVLFAVLPWGVHSQQEEGEVAPGTDPGAPIVPHLRRKVVWTTIVTTVVFGAWYILYVNHLIPLDRITSWLGAS